MATAATEQSRTSPLREWRLAAGWTLEDESGLTGYSTAHLSLVERNLRTPSPQAKVHIARCLGVTVAEIFPPEPPAVDDEGGDVAVARESA